MKTAALLLLLAACSGQAAAPRPAPAPAASPLPDLTAQADRLARQGRAELESAGDEAALRRAEDRLARAYALRAEPEIAGDLARARFLLAVAHLRGEARTSRLASALEDAEQALRGASPAFARAAEQGAAFEDAVAQVEAAAAPQLHRFLVTLDAWSQASGIPAFLGQRGKLRAGVERLFAIAPDHEGGAAHRLRGVLLAATPAAAGGDLPASRAAFERALEAGPAHQLNRVDFARTWAVKAQDRARFEELLGEVLASPPDAAPVPENAAARVLARELLGEVGRLF